MDINQQQTAIDSNRAGEQSGAHENLREALLRYAADRLDFTDREAMDYFKKPRNTLSGARHALYLAGWLVVNGTRRDPVSGRGVIAWKFCKEPRPIERLSAKQKVTLAKKAVEQLAATGYQDKELVIYLQALLYDEPIDKEAQRAIYLQ